MSGMADALRRRLMDELPGFGRHLGYDGKAVTSDPDADWGKHETRGVDRRTGKAWTRVKTWFGYAHLADVVPVRGDEASRSEHKVPGLDEPDPPIDGKLWDVYRGR